VVRVPKRSLVGVALLATWLAGTGRAIPADPVAHSIEQFLARNGQPRAFKALRRMDAEHRGDRGWLEAITEYTAAEGFRYRITAEGGSEELRTRVLKAVLDGELEASRVSEVERSALVPSNYRFAANGVDADGLANVLLTPRRKEPALISGTMFLRPDDGTLVRVQGRLAKSPSFWVQDVEVVRTYKRFDGVAVPMTFQSKAHVRFLGEATLRETYVYSEIDGRQPSSGT
jgi:hypothetical protein